MRRLIYFCAAMMLLACHSLLMANEAVLELTEAEQQWLRENPLIRVANEEDWMPFDYAVDGKPLGYSIDLMTLLADKLGLQLEFVNGLSWQELYDAFAGKEIHVMPAIYKTQARQELFYFTPSYFANPSVIVVNVNQQHISDIDDLAGRKVAGVRGFAINKVLQEKVEGLELVEYDGVVECLKAVSLGKVDAYIDSIGLVAFTLEHNFIPNLRVIGDLEDGHFSNPALHMAVHKDNRVLGELLSKALAVLSRAEKNSLSRKWLDLKRYEKQIIFTEEQIKWIHKHPVVEVGIDADYAPYSFVNEEDRYVGIVPDFLELLSDKIGIKFIIKEGLSWSEIIEQGKQHQLDVVSPIVPTEQRRLHFNFSPVYIPAPLVIVSHIERDDINKPADLSRLKIALVRHYSSSERVVRDNPGIEPLWVDTSLEALQLVATGQADAFVSVIGVATHQMREHGFSNLKLAAYYDEDYPGQRFAVRSDWPELAVLISEALDDISEEERKAIYDRWISISFEERFDYVFFFQMLAVFSCIVILLAFYNRKLSREIMRREKVEIALNDMNKSLEESRLAAEAANKAKTEFIASMSHELRTPLMAIIGFSDILVLDEDLRAESKTKLVQIHKAGQHLLKLIDDLMDLTMIESGHLKLHCQPVAIKPLLDESIALVEPLLQEKALSIRCDYQMGDEVVHVDVLRIKQVVLNLLANAIKYNREHGSIDVHATVEHGFVKLDIEDSGIGIDEEQLGRLFDYYERLGAEQSGVPGRGMGLPIARKLLEAMGGRIAVHSEPGKGSCFSLFIPMAS